MRSRIDGAPDFTGPFGPYSPHGYPGVDMIRAGLPPPQRGWFREGRANHRIGLFSTPVQISGCVVFVLPHGARVSSWTSELS